MTSKLLARKIAGYLRDKQAEDIVILNLSKLTTLADYFVIATGTVDVHVKAIVDHVRRSLTLLDDPVKPSHVEGYTHLSWVLLDYGDVIVHVLRPGTRDYYQLEKLWGDAPVERFADHRETIP